METMDTIRLGKMFCPANDRNVPILFRDRRAEVDPAVWGLAGEPISCLDYGFRCTGWLCPHFAVPELPSLDLLEAAARGERRRVARGAAERRRTLERAFRENGLRGDENASGRNARSSPLARGTLEGPLWHT
jgi:hypothetical protein